MHKTETNSTSFLRSETGKINPGPAILYVESMKDYIKVVTKSGTIISRQSISSVEAMCRERNL
jgi:DNA-binding LytR/AlgR family response regulator